MFCNVFSVLAGNERSFVFFERTVSINCVRTSLLVNCFGCGAIIIKKNKTLEIPQGFYLDYHVTLHYKYKLKRLQMAEKMKNAVIIGGTSGIGKGLASILAAHNYNVYITGRRENLMQNSGYEYRLMDVTNIDDTTKKLDELALLLGNIDLFIISAGTGDVNNSLDFETEKRTIDVNVLGFTAIADWAFRYFEKQKCGHLVAISSVAGLRGSFIAPAYNATKAYQINYLEGLMVKAAKLKLPVTITDVRPGFVDTDMAKGDGLFWVASVDKACSQIYNAIKKRKRVVYITKRWRLIAVIIGLLPFCLYRKV